MVFGDVGISVQRYLVRYLVYCRFLAVGTSILDRVVEIIEDNSWCGWWGLAIGDYGSTWVKVGLRCFSIERSEVRYPGGSWRLLALSNCHWDMLCGRGESNEGTGSMPTRIIEWQIPFRGQWSIFNAYNGAAINNWSQHTWPSWRTKEWSSTLPGPLNKSATSYRRRCTHRCPREQTEARALRGVRNTMR